MALHPGQGFRQEFRQGFRPGTGLGVRFLYSRLKLGLKLGGGGLTS